MHRPHSSGLGTGTWAIIKITYNYKDYKYKYYKIKSVEHHLSKQKVASSNPGSAWSWSASLTFCYGSYRIYAASRFTQPNAREIVCEG